MKKIGLICLAVVLAVGALGVGYAAWTDTIVVDGTVNTGTVDINIMDFSGTWVWKVDHETVKIHGLGTAVDRPAGPDGGELISYAETVLISLDPDESGSDYAVVEFNNLYPCEWFWVDFLVHYNGTIPARLHAEIETTDPWLQGLWDDGYAGVAAFEWNPDEPNPMLAIGDEVDIHDLQLHDCDWIKVILWIHIPQEWDPGDPTTNTQDDLSGQSGSFTATVTAIQWNEYDDYIAA